MISLNHFLEIYERQIESAKNGQIEFLMYPTGAGGEFFSIYISEYSSNNYFKTPNSVNSTLNKYENRYNLIHSSCQSDLQWPLQEHLDRDLYSPEEFWEWISFHSHRSLLHKSYSNFLIDLDIHLSKGGKFLSRIRDSIDGITDESNSYFLDPDTDDMKKYTESLAKIKAPTAIIYDPWIEKYQPKNKIASEHNFNRLQMSEIYNNPGYLESRFNINDIRFSQALTSYHKKNLALIKEKQEFLRNFKTLY
jgi:hypothetical protein